MAKVVLKKKLMPSYTEYLERGSYTKEKVLTVMFEGTPTECFRWLENSPDNIPRGSGPDPVYPEVIGEDGKEINRTENAQGPKETSTEDGKLPF